MTTATRVRSGYDLVPLLTSAMLAATLEEHGIHVVEGLEPSKPRPSVLAPLGISLQPRPAG